jgi:DNA repair protein RecO (recombination protein O)
VRFCSAPAILLDVVDLAEQDRIAVFLTAEHGLVRGVANGARRKHSRYAGQLQPLAKVAVTWVEKEGRDLVRISEVNLLRPASGLRESLEGLLLGGYLADQMRHFAQENEESELLFRLLDSTLESLEAGVPTLAARYYEAWMLRLAGIFPAPRECPSCGRAFGPGDAGALANAADAVICTDCARLEPPAQRLSPDVLAFLRDTARKALPALASALPTPAVLAESEQLCARIRRAFLGRELASYDMMQRTLAGLDGP